MSTVKHSFYDHNGTLLEQKDVDLDVLDYQVSKIAPKVPDVAGRWTVRNEGEDNNGVVSHIAWAYEPALLLATFTSYQYPEDNHVLGIFSTNDKAEAAITREIEGDKASHPNYPARYQQKRDYYHIEELFLDDHV